MRLKAYWTAFAVQAKQVSRYRAAAFGGMVTQAFFGTMLVALYDTLIGDRTLFRETVTYVWIQQIFFRAFFTSDTEFNEQIIQGAVCYTLLRPVDLHLWCVIREMAGKIVNVLMRLVPMVLLLFLLPQAWRIRPPENALGLAQFTVSLAVGFLSIAQINLIVSAVLMRTMDNKGITAMINLIMMILGGNIIPLTIVPERIQTLLRYQPFAQMLDAPIRMYLHTMSAPEWLLSLGIQLFWLAAMGCLSRGLWSRNIRRIELQGG